MEKLVKPIAKVAPNRKALLFLFVICGAISFVIWIKAEKRLTWIQPFRISYLVNQINRDTNRGTQEVLEQIRKKISSNTGIYGIIVYRIEDKVWYGINEDLEFKGASILKVPVMSVAINAGLEKEYGEYTGRQLVFAMGKYSDNDATTTLVESIGREAIQSEIENMGMDKTLFSENTTTPLAVVEMWKSVYKKPDMWEFLEDSIFEDRIAPNIPDNSQLIHKVGTDEGVWADSGIIQCTVLSEKCSVKPYILVILNKETKREEAEKTVPEIAEIIMKYEAETARQKLQQQASPEGKLK